MSLSRRLRKRFIKTCCPAIVQRWLKYRRPLPRRSADPNKHSLQTRRINPGCELEIYWLDAALGSGPAASLYLLEDEVIRLDCLDTNAHMHLNMKQARLIPGASSARIWFPAGSFEDHINRAVFELAHNLDYAIKTNVSSRVRQQSPDPQELADAAKWMCFTMKRLVEENIELCSSISPEPGPRQIDEPYE